MISRVLLVRSRRKAVGGKEAEVGSVLQLQERELVLTWCAGGTRDGWAGELLQHSSDQRFSFLHCLHCREKVTGHMRRVVRCETNHMT